MYTYGMYRLVDVTREGLLAKLRAVVKSPLEEPPAVAGVLPDLATARRRFFVAESSERITALIPVVEHSARDGYETVLVVPEGLATAAGEAWDYLTPEIKPRVKIMPIPDDSRA